MSPRERDRRLRQRKVPRQPRAVETRARILAAAAEVFEAHGYEAGTTNRIAAAASMSVGSIYQYFPNKDAILVALFEQHLVDGADRAAAALAAGSGDAPLEQLVAEVVAQLLALHREAPRLHHVLLTRTPLPADLADQLGALEHRLVADLAGFLDLHPEVRSSDAKRTAAVVVTAVNGIVHTQIATPEPAIDDATLVEEATAMVVGYLRTER